VAQRFHAGALSIEGQTTSQIAQSLKVHRSSIPLWMNTRISIETGIVEGHRAAVRRDSPCAREQLQIFWTAARWLMVLEAGIWTSPVISRVIGDEFNLHYHPDDRKLLKQLAIRAASDARLVQGARTGRTAGSLTYAR